MNMNITGGIVTYNNEKIILKCIGSILDDAKDLNFKLYIYDNASTDKTVDIIRERFPEVTVIQGRENRGFGYGHNRIMEKMISDFHFVINPDIIIDHGTSVINELSIFLKEHPGVGIVTPQIRYQNNCEQFLPKKDPTVRYVLLSKIPLFRFYRDIYTDSGHKFEKPTKIISSTGCFFAIRTILAKKLKGFDERFFMYFEDADLSRRTRKIQDIYFYPNTFVYHLWKRDNTHSIKGVCVFFKSMFKYFWKWKSEGNIW